MRASCAPLSCDPDLACNSGIGYRLAMATFKYRLAMANLQECRGEKVRIPTQGSSAPSSDDYASSADGRKMNSQSVLG